MYSPKIRTAYYSIDRAEINRKEIKISERYREMVRERCNGGMRYGLQLGMKKPQDLSCYRLGAFLSLVFWIVWNVTNAPDKTLRSQSVHGLLDFLHRQDTVHLDAASFS